MTNADLAQVEAWLREPHVARWWASGTTVEAQMEKYRRRVAEEDTATVILMVTEDGRPVGWCQWYRWHRHPEAADAIGALRGEVGVDYAIGELGAIGRGLGTEMIAALVAEVRRYHPGAGVLVDPEAANRASRRCSRPTASAWLPSALSKANRPKARWPSTACQATRSAAPEGSSLARRCS